MLLRLPAKQTLVQGHCLCSVFSPIDSVPTEVVFEAGQRSGQPQKLRFPRFPGRARLSQRANQRSAPAAERKRKETAGVRRQQKGRKEAERAGPFAHSEHQPKECAGSRKEEKRPDGRAVTELQR